MKAMVGGLVMVGLLAVPSSAEAADVVTPLDGGVNAGVVLSLHGAELRDTHSQGFEGAPTSLSQGASGILGARSSQYVEGSSVVTAAWTSPDRGAIDLHVSGAIQATCCGNAVYTSPTYLDDWHYTFVPSRDAVLRLRGTLTGTGSAGTCGVRVFINGLQAPGFGAPEDGSTVTTTREYALIAGETTTLSLDNCAGFSTTSSSLSTFSMSASFAFEILLPDGGFTALLDEVKGLDINDGTRGALQRKLENALAALQRGDAGAARALLEAFINAVDAQRGKTLTDAQADSLVASAQALIDSLP